mmetsp:Transcript_40711/g.131139  ORF Transcript_40711/g.131139 Transcript_40711/m.131139 type:complete len:118 (+) Transcript_40711:215-568(+)
MVATWDQDQCRRVSEVGVLIGRLMTNAGGNDPAGEQKHGCFPLKDASEKLARAKLKFPDMGIMANVNAIVGFAVAHTPSPRSNAYSSTGAQWLSRGSCASTRCTLLQPRRAALGELP